ncbi:MAG: signal peptidase I [Spirochaetaceae bacterium]
MHIVVNRLIKFTENILTYKKRSSFIKSEKQKKLHPILDWVGAFIWAAGVVLLLNQYLFQAYVIPSKSMENTLLVGDRIFVNKFIYGPELLPGIKKMTGIESPNRTDIIIFENPEYVSKGPVFDLVQRLTFMLTLSMIDIDKDSDGNPAHHFLIKRSIAADGDIVQFRNGELYIKPQGESDYLHEGSFKDISKLNYNTNRLLVKERYFEIDQNIRSSVYNNQNNKSSVYYQDKYFSILSNYKYLSHLSPSMLNYYQEFNKQSTGIYVPKGWILPLGDNRDNSKDGRYFGPIKESEVLGQASFNFWPIKRIGVVK